MYFGIEFFAETSLTISPKTFFKTKLFVDEIELTNFSGGDLFEFNCVILKDRRVCASGRTCSHKLEDLPLGLGALNVPPAQQAFLTKDFQKAQILLETNLFKDPLFLERKLGLKLISQITTSPVPLISPQFKIEYQENQIHIDITTALKKAITL